METQVERAMHMPTNTELTAKGSTGECLSKVEFEASYNGYTLDSDGLDQVVEDYKIDLVKLVNKARATLAINTERAKLTAGDRQETKAKSNAFDEIANASTEEEKMALMKKHNLM